MASTKGKIARISFKETTPDNYGNNVMKSFKLEGDDNWYGLGKGKGEVLKVKRGKEFVEVNEGDTVEFMYDESEWNGKIYYNTKSINIKLVAKGDGSSSVSSVSKGGSQTPSSTSPSQSKGGGYEAGIKVGHAINNAVQIAISTGDTSDANIRKISERILRLSKTLEAEYLEVVGTVGSEVPKEQVQSKADEVEEVAPKPVQKSAVAKTSAPKSVVEFSDDLPF